MKQECIPVGCVPSAAVTVSLGGVSTPGGLPRGVSAPGVVCSGGVVCSRGGGCSGGVGIPACTEADTPNPPPGQTDACKNITFATSLRTVKREEMNFKECEQASKVNDDVMLMWMIPCC